MSKLLAYLLGFIALLLIGGFIFFAISTPDIEQNEIILEIPAGRFG